jgi:hypothetical protein
MEDGRNYESAIEFRNNCLAAVSEAQDFEDARLFWRRAKGYNMLAKSYGEDAGGRPLERRPPSPRAPGVLVGAREQVEW